MPDVVDSLRVRIEGDARAASGDIDKLVKQLEALQAAVKPLQNMNLGGALKPASSGMRAASGDAERMSAAEKDLAKNTTKASGAIRSQGREAAKAHKSFSLASTALGKFLSSVKRIAYYRMIRSAIKAVTQGFSEGIENMYRWSQIAGTTFAPSMDRLATAALYLKNGFASMWSPLIEYAIPIIDRVVDKLVDFFNLAQEGFARLTGAPTWTKALKYPVQFAEATDDAAKSAKALQNILMGWDEMNVINTPNDRGRGGSGDEMDYSSMFQLMQTEAASGSLAEWADRLKRLAETFAPAFAPIKRILDDTVETLGELVDATGEWIDNTDFQPLANGVFKVNNALADLVVTVNDDLVRAYKTVLLPIASWFVEKGLPAALDTTATAIGVVESATHALNTTTLAFMDNTKDLREKTGEFFLNRNDEIKKFLQMIREWIDRSTPTFERLGAAVGKLFNSLGKVVIPLLDLIAKVGFQPFIQGIGLILSLLTPLLEVLATILDLVNAIVGKPLELLGGGAGIVGKILTGDFVGAYEDMSKGIGDIVSGKFTNEWGGDFVDFGENNLSKFQLPDNTAADIYIAKQVMEEADTSAVGLGESFKNLWKAMWSPETWKKLKNFKDEFKDTFTEVDEVVAEKTESAITSFRFFMDTLLGRTQSDLYETVTLVDTETGRMVLAVDKSGNEILMTYDDYMNKLKQKTNVGLWTITNSWEINGQEWFTITDEYGNKTVASYDEVLNQLDVNSQREFIQLVQKYRTASGDMANAFKGIPKSITEWKLWDKLYMEALDAADGFKNGLRAGLRNFSLNIPATISVTNTTSTQKVHGATFDMSLFDPSVVRGYASGGFPSPGELFWAGENRIPEIMGRVNGRSAVVGGAEITGISDTIRAQGAREEQLLETLIGVVQAKDFSFVPNAASGRLINQALRLYAGVTG